MATIHAIETEHTIPDRKLLEDIAGELARIATLVEDKTNANALNKAAYHLSHGVEIILSAGDFLIPSGTRAGVVHRISGAGCNCEAGMKGKPCWHAALAETVAVAWERAGLTDDEEGDPGDGLPIVTSNDPDKVLDPRDELVRAYADDEVEWY